MRETLSLVRGEGVGSERGDLEQRIKRHEEYRTQIDRQLDQSQAVKNEGRSLIQEGTFMCQEVDHICACMCVCVCVCVCACMLKYIYVNCECDCVHVSMCLVCVCAFIPVCVYVSVFKCMHQ